MTHGHTREDADAPRTAASHEAGLPPETPTHASAPVTAPPGSGDDAAGNDGTLPPASAPQALAPHERAPGRTYAGRAVLSIFLAFLALASVPLIGVFTHALYAAVVLLTAAAAVVTGYAARQQLRADPSLSGAGLSFLAFLIGLGVFIANLPLFFTLLF